MRIRNYIRKKLFLKLFLSVLLVNSYYNPALAYPSLARHGYTTCVTCHYNPSGGGILTPYGKIIAGELLGLSNDSSEAWPWLVEPKEESIFVATLLARGAQTYFNLPQVKRSEFRNMQFDLEGGLVANGWQAIAAAGPRLDAAVEGKSDQSSLTIRRFWLGKISNNYALRAGKFFPEFGINHFNHNIATRRGLYFNHNQEPYNIQASHFTDTFDFTLSLLKGARETQLMDKKGYSGTVSYKVGMSRFGFSNIAMSDTKSKTSAQSIFIQSGYFGHGYTLAEFAFKSNFNAKSHKNGDRVGYFESGWEVKKGVTPYLAAEYSRRLLVNAKTQSLDLGIQLNLITHLELILQSGKSFIQLGEKNQTATHAFAMIKLYF